MKHLSKFCLVLMLPALFALLMAMLSVSQQSFNLLKPENNAQLYDNRVTFVWENAGVIKRTYINFNNPSAKPHIEFPKFTELSGSIDFTASIWVRFNAQPPVADHDKVIDFSLGTGFQLNYESTSEGLRFTVRDQNLNEIKLPTYYTPPVGEWHLYTIVFQRGVRMAVYEDNRLLRELTSGVPTSIGDWSTQNPGANLVGVGLGQNYPVNAAVDDFRIYRRALSQAEIENLWLGKPIDNTDLFGWWKMDEGSGSTVFDASGNNRNGTLRNSPQWVTEGNLLCYEIWLDGSNIENTTSTSYTKIVSTGDHNWQIVAVLDNGDKIYSSVFKFSILEDNIPPAPFNLISPENNAILTSTNVTFSWENSSDAQTGLAGYELWVDGSKVVTTTLTSHTLQLQAGTYSWYVVALDKAGNSRSSQIFTFSIVTVRPFTLTAPNGAWISSPPIVLVWENAPDMQVQRYEVWIDGVNVENTTSNTVVLSNVSAGVHEWWVVAVGAGGERKRSENTFIFGVGNPPEYPRREFVDGFEQALTNYSVSGMQLTTNAIYGTRSLQYTGTGIGYAYRNDVMLGEEEGRVSVIFVLDSSNPMPGVGFASDNGIWVFAYVDTAAGDLIVARKAGYSIFNVTPYEWWKRDEIGGLLWAEEQVGGEYIWKVEWAGTGSLQQGTPYRLVLEYSRRSKTVMAYVQEVTGFELARVRTVVDTDYPRYPLILSRGPARFDNFSFSFLDTWTYRWRVDLPWNPVLTPTPGTWDRMGAFNPGVAYANGTFYMIYRGNPTPAPPEGPPNSNIGLATSTDGVHWTKHPSAVITDGRPEDPELLYVNGRFYAEYTNVDTSQGRMAWSTDGINWSSPWVIAVHDQYGQHKVVAILDLDAWPSGRRVTYGGQTYRFIGYKEGGGVIFTNNLEQSNWIVTGGGTVSAGNNIWGDSENPVGDAFVDSDGNIRVLICASTREGYVGGTEATIAEAIFDGSQPWRLLKVSTLPFIPVYYGKAPNGATGAAWNDGPNFPGQTILVDNWLYCYYGANDTNTGLAVAYYGPEFEYRDLTATVLGQQATVSLKVRNVGSHDGSGWVKLYVNGQLFDTKTFTLVRENETTLAFTIPLSGLTTVWIEGLIPINNKLGLSAGQYSFVRPSSSGVGFVEIARLSLALTPSAENVPIFVVENLRLSKENVKPGENITVSVDVANVGTAAGSRTLVLKVDGVEVESREVTLGAGQKTTVTFPISVEELGEHTVSVDGLSATFFVGRMGANFILENLTLSKDKVKRGEKVTVSVIVKNIGDETGSYLVMLKVDGVLVESKNVSLDPSQSTTVNFTIEIEEVGEHTISVGNLSKILTVVEEGVSLPVVLAIGIVCAAAVVVMLLKFIVLK
ncbi:MAG: LamG-like jellyroll fold domain-containing protein [Candidatus Hadarchaeales archaeon]